MLHLLQDRVLGALQVLDEYFLALLRRLQPIKLLNQLSVLLDKLLVLFSDLVNFLGAFMFTLDTRVRSMGRGTSIDGAARPVRQLLVLGCRSRSDLVLLLLIA